MDEGMRMTRLSFGFLVFSLAALASCGDQAAGAKAGLADQDASDADAMVSAADADAGMETSGDVQDAEGPDGDGAAVAQSDITADLEIDADVGADLGADVDLLAGDSDVGSGSDGATTTDGGEDAPDVFDATLDVAGQQDVDAGTPCPLSCDDGNGCTIDACVPGLGCQHVNGSGNCDDDNACTVVDVCVGGTCVPGLVATCNDGQICTDDSCLPASGCVHLANGATCSDGNVCTVGDACTAGGCQLGTPMDCDDGNLCTVDFCAPYAGCVHLAIAVTCDDGSACTQGDICKGTACSGSTISCDDANPCTSDSCDLAQGCKHTPSSAACSDNDACTLADACTDGACVGGATLDCTDGNVCTDDSCSAATGCVHLTNSVTCDDGNACTAGDACADAKCSGAAVNCDDQNPCTMDSCDLPQGCTHTANSGPCSDGNSCTLVDICAQGGCVPGALQNCADGNPCTDDACVSASGCQHLANDQNSCSDNNNCTVGDHCGGGLCVATGPSNCDDGNACTTESCGGGGCVVANNSSACDDGSVCTANDICSGGACHSGAAINCSDGLACTDDACSAKSGCVHAPNSAPCTDGNACTVGDGCIGGVCLPGTPTSCDDGNFCTLDLCASGPGCSHTANASACNDGNPCTDDGCDASGNCAHAANSGACNDGNLCTSGDKCVAGACVSGVTKDCNDNNLCTQDFCSNGGCVHVQSVACIDGNPCTTEVCDPILGCVVTGAGDCNDGNPCTDDACATNGCSHTSNELTCSDGSVCTPVDTCFGGTCHGGAPLNCSDGSSCTDDACDPVLGCMHAPRGDGSGCNGENTCSSGGTCTSGVCSAPETSWFYKTYGGAGTDVAHAITAIGDGYALAGETNSKGSGNNDIWVVRTAHDGALLWDKSLGDGGPDTAAAIFTSPRGLAVFGTHYTVYDTPQVGFGARDYWMTELDDGGNILAQRLYGTAQDETLAAVLQLSDGYWLNGAGGTVGAWNMRTDIAGNVLWQHWGNDMYGRPMLTPGGVLFISSTTLAMFDLNGNALWSKSWTGQTILQATFLESSGFGVFTSMCLGSCQTYVENFSATGTLSGIKPTLTKGDSNTVFGAAQRADGILLAGSLPGPSGNGEDIWLLHVSPIGMLTGELTWGGTGSDMAHAAIGDGNAVVIAGETTSFGAAGTDFLLVRTDPWATTSCAATGPCVNTAMNACDDANDCTNDLCDAAHNGCYHTVVATAAYCQKTPTTLGLCMAGVCK